MAGKISVGARREVVSAVTERYRSAKASGEGTDSNLDELCATTGWHRKLVRWDSGRLGFIQQSAESHVKFVDFEWLLQ